MSLHDEGIRHTCYYRGNPMYVYVSDRALSISMVALSAKEHTLEALDIISGLTTMLLENGTDSEKISSVIWECSRRNGSLADSLSKVLIHE